jgi:hypothetical protein
MSGLLGYDSPVFRVYEPDECGPEGYPRQWSHLSGAPEEHDLLNEADMVLPGGLKDVVRALCGYRCARCGHPYRKGQEQFWAEPAVPESMVETAALALFDAEPVDEPRVKRASPVHWSPCDERCTHGGPVRARRRSPQAFPWRVWEATHPSWRAGELVAGGEEVQAAWRVLTVHHLTGVKHDCRWWNLCPLCQRCHLSIQTTVEMENPWPWEHEEWFKPYVAGFYASKYEGRDVSRAEALERMDELLQHERGRFAMREQRPRQGVRSR